MGRKIISVVGLKGGVGKSTLASCLAIYYMSEYRLPVNILDLDTQNITQYQTFFNLDEDDFVLRRDIPADITIVNEPKIKDNMINIADYPCNKGIDDYLEFIKDNSSVLILPTTYETADLHVLIHNTIETFKDIEPKVVFFNKTSKKDQEFSMPNKIMECNEVFKTGFPYRKKFFNGIIDDLDISFEDISKSLSRMREFKQLVQYINPYVLL